jgi:ABC1 atypical kinase-like domain
MLRATLHVICSCTLFLVQTQSFEEGVRAIDADAISAQGISLPATARLISQAFCEQAFKHGHVHCDPHGKLLLLHCYLYCCNDGLAYDTDVRLRDAAM